MTTEFVAFISRLPNALALAGFFLVVGFLATRLAFRENPVARFLCQFASFGGFTIMLLAAGVLPFEPTPREGPDFSFVLISVFKIVWWLAASWLFAGFFRAVLVFKRQPRDTRFLQDLFVGVIYAAAGLAIVANVFDMPVGGLLAASGVVAIVLGLALQSTLGDVFSGIVLNLAKPYHPGDWIILDGGTQGCVVETDWRATHILTPDNDLAIIPNSVIAKAQSDQREPAHEGSRSDDPHPARADRRAVQRPCRAAGRVTQLQSDPPDSCPYCCRSKSRRRRHGVRDSVFRFERRAGA